MYQTQQRKRTETETEEERPALHEGVCYIACSCAAHTHIHVMPGKTCVFLTREHIDHVFVPLLIVATIHSRTDTRVQGREREGEGRRRWIYIIYATDPVPLSLPPSLPTYAYK